MSLPFQMSVQQAPSTESPRPGRAAATVRQTARAVLAGAKRVGQAVLVLGIFAVMLAAAMALGLLTWVPHFHVNS